MWLGICSMGRTRIGFWTWIWSMDYLWSMNLVSFDSSNSTGAFDAKMNGSLLEEDSSFKMLGLNFVSKLDRSSYIISIVKRALIRSMKFLSPEVALYLYKSTIKPCMEGCCYFWAGAPICYLELLDKQQKGICRTVGPSLAACLEWTLDSTSNYSQLKYFL